MTRAELKPGYQRVHTVLDYYDGPRKGVADFEGEPHLYECIFNEAKGNYSDSFLLMAIDDESFRAAVEDWAIWERWESNYRTGRVDLSTHPALPNERKRHDELQSILQNVLVIDPKKSITRVGHFEPIGSEPLPTGVLRQLQVKWILKLPDRIKGKVGSFPESSYGAHLVTLVLDDSTRISHVRIAGWDEIVDDSLPGLRGLDVSRIVDAESEV